MKERFYIFSTIFLALTAMPVNVFADMANNLLRPDSPEILAEAERINKEANRFRGTHDDAAIFVLHPLSVNTNQMQKHVAISNAVANWKEKCTSAVLIPASTAKSYTTRATERGSDTIFTCVIADCKDPAKYKVAKDGSMCEMTKEYERQLDREARDQKKEEKLQQKQEDNLRETKAEIIRSKDNIVAGASITYNDSDYSELKPLIEQWKTACSNAVKKVYPNGRSDAEGVAVSKGKTRLTCYIEDCGSSDLQVSNNRKSCEQTAEEKQRIKEQNTENARDRCGGRDGSWDAKKGCLCNGRKMPDDDSVCEQKVDGRYKASDNGQSIVDSINASKNKIKIGSSISVTKTDLELHDNVDTAISEWESACSNLSDTDKSVTAFDEDKGDKTIYTCLIQTCKQSGYEPSSDKKSCKQTAEAKRLDREYKVSDNGQSIVDSINASKNKIKIGSSISVTTRDIEFYDKVDTAVSEWEVACGNLSDAEKSVVSNDQVKGDKTIYTCLIQTCKQSGYEPSSDKKSCKQTKEAKKLDKEYKSSDNGQSIVDEINTSKNKIKIGSSISVTKTDLELRDNVDTAISEWESACSNLSDTDKSVTAFDEEKDDKIVYTCLIQTCKQSGYEPNSKKTKCELSSEACKASTDAEWQINKCVCKDKKLVWNSDEQKCVTKSGECKDLYGKGVGHYDENGKCKLEDCEGKNYTLNTDKNKCELNSTANIRNSKIEKEFIADVNKLISAFDSFIDKHIKECQVSPDGGQS